MIKLDITKAMQLLCKSTHKWAMYIHMNEFSVDNPAAPYLTTEDYQLISDGSGIILFESEGEMSDTYNRTVGEDGPTKLNDYNGANRVYALTCSPNGELISENT